MALLTKEEQDFYIELGKRDFTEGVPCQPYQSKQLSEQWKNYPCKIGSEESKKQTEAAGYWMKGWTMANLSPKVGIKFVRFEDIYENCNDGTDYWVICSNLPQKYIDKAKALDGDSYLESCFGLIVTYGYEVAPKEGEEKEWFIDFGAPFYVDNNGNWNYLDYTLTEEEKAEVIQMCKEERNRTQMLEKIKEVMSDLMQRDCFCNYIVEQNGVETYCENILATEAYMKAYEMSKNGDVEYYMAVLGKKNKASHPIFSIKNGEVDLSGQKFTVEPSLLAPASVKKRGR